MPSWVALEHVRETVFYTEEVGEASPVQEPAAKVGAVQREEIRAMVIHPGNSPSLRPVDEVADKLMGPFLGVGV